MTRNERFLTSAAFGLMGGMMAVFAVLAMVQTSGCKNPDLHSRPQDDTAYAERSINKITKRADSIEDNADVIQRRTPRASLLRIIENVQAIKFNAGAIREDVTDGVHALGEANKKIEAQGVAIADKDKRIAQLVEENTSWQRKAGASGITLGLFTVAGGVMALVYGRRWGKAVAIGGIVLIGGGAAIAIFSWWIGLAFAVGAVVIVGAYVWHDLHVKSKAVPELVSTNEVLKQVAAPSKRKEVFGDGAMRGQADIIQSKSTRKLVKAVRGKAAEIGKIRLAKTEESPVPVKVEE